jgi:hypothetical protein
MQLMELLEQAKSHLAAATGLRSMTVTGAHRDEKGWRVSLEMLEMSRIPPATDVVGEYIALLSSEGELLWFERKRTRLRGERLEAESS